MCVSEAAQEDKLSLKVCSAVKYSSLEICQHLFNRSIMNIDCVTRASSVHCQTLNCFISPIRAQSNSLLSGGVRVLHKLRIAGPQDIFVTSPSPF